MPGWLRAVVITMMLWWGFFGSISLSWALGSPWLVDTVLQGNGLRLAQERPTWFVVVSYYTISSFHIDCILTFICLRNLL